MSIDKVVNTRSVWDILREKGVAAEECEHVVHKPNPGDVCTHKFSKGTMCPGIENCAHQTLLMGAIYIDEGAEGCRRYIEEHSCKSVEYGNR